MFIKGLRRDLELKDMYNARPSDHSEILGDLLEQNWFNEVKKAKRNSRKPLFVNALYATFWKSYAFWGFVYFINVCIIRYA